MYIFAQNFLFQKMLYKANQIPPVLSSNSMHLNGPTAGGGNLPLNIIPPQPVPPVLSGHFPNVSQDIDLRSVVDPRLNRNMDMDMRSMPPTVVPTTNMLDPTYLRQQSRVLPVSTPFPTDPRQRGDPRVKPTSSIPTLPPPTIPVSIQQAQLPNRIPTGIPNDASDQEKAALIMQVLQLSDEQIAMLPPEQRASILVLKEQIAKSTQR